MKIHSGSLRLFKEHDCPTEVPDSLLSDEWAQRNHGQSLNRLNERGGMGVTEILENIKKLPWSSLGNETIEHLKELKGILLIAKTKNHE